MAGGRARDFGCKLRAGISFSAIICAAMFATASVAVPLPPPRPSNLVAHVEAPLPPPRPADLPSAKSDLPRLAMLTPPSAPATPSQGLLSIAPLRMPERPEEAAVCDALLASGAVAATRLPPISGDNGCGITSPVALEAVILPDKRKIPIEPHPILRCDLAAEAAHWISEDLIPSIEAGGGRVARLVGVGGYQCRSRNRAFGAILSEHGRGNALDLGGVMLANGRVLSVSAMSDNLEVATDVRAAACSRFATVLGPGADSAHENHVHLDLEPRRNGGRICQWDLQ